MSNQDSQDELRASLAMEIFNQCEKPLEYVTKLVIADAEEGELRGMAVREYNPDMIKTRYANELARVLAPFINAHTQKAVTDFANKLKVVQMNHAASGEVFDVILKSELDYQLTKDNPKE